MKMGFYGKFVTSNQILFKKIYRKKSVSAGWKHGFVNRAALWHGILREINKSHLPSEIKSKILRRIFLLGLEKAKLRLRLLE
jgi:hypothetical protein